MSLDKKIIKEIERHRKINQYILEQAGIVPEPDALGALAPVPGAAPAPAPAEAVPPLPPDGGGTGAQPIDVEADPDVEKIDDEGESEEGGRIYISVRDVKLNSINNLASVLVHESFHLYIWKRKFILSPKEEENYCYRYELEHVNKLPNLEPWLKSHVIEQIKNTQN